ncbi:hypothetical protein C3B33_07765 [Campylobacter upsaliensis]|nr:hypothetical protein [Campylobacter upsaliensis]
MKVCIAGKNDIAVNALEFLLTFYEPKDLIVVPNQNDEGKDTWQRSLKKAAQKYGVKIVSLEKCYDVKDLLFISLEFDLIIKPEKFVSKRLFNIHFSNLPKYKGVYTSIMPILYGEKEAGVTLHCIDDGIDTGDIISQRLFKIGLNDTARDLYFKYLKNAFLLFKLKFKNLESGNYKRQKQDLMGSFFTRKSVEFERKLDLNKTSFEIHNELRAFIFEEYQLPQINHFQIVKSRLSKKFIGRKVFKEFNDKFILSGIDGFKIEVRKK